MEAYLLQYRIYFNVNPAKFLINEVRVKYIINLLRDEAFGWFKYIVKDYLTNLVTGVPWCRARVHCARC